ncbi:anthrone oxygenase family protein [Sorangium sp. So ce321]|uniref:anthrone oxygenase family protein n=1 Tax=Sorangium sp. So ce321 TaxID=3133300 RepID=UPI003F64185F
MMPRALFLLTIGSTLGCGLIAGVFFAFSSFVMPALAKLPPAQGVAAMQSINVVVLNRWFLGVFVGTAGACLIVAIASLVSWSEAGSRLRVAGSALYILGTFLVTMARNVPLNAALAGVPPEAAVAAETWARYVPAWTSWNTVRTLAALASAALFTLALVQSARAD